MSQETNARKRGPRWPWALLAIAVLVGAGAAGFRVLRGPSGATAALGGSIPATPAPELPADAAHWVNGAPVTLAGVKGQVLIVEGWHPA
jgi:hypothetical protein